MKQNRVSDEALRLSFFPNSLTHHATAWYDRLPRNSIHTFDNMMRKFLSKYFLHRCGPPKKLPEKLRDPGRFLKPCDFQGLESCMALSDLGASIKLIPLSVWKKLSLPDLTSTRITLELATRTFAYPTRIVKDVFVQVGKFTFLADFIVIDYDVNPRVPLILGRPFLRTVRALVDHGNDSVNMINFIDITCEDRFLKVLKFKKSNYPSSGSTTILFYSSPNLTPFETSDSLLEEFADELTLLDLITPGKEDNNFDFEADLGEIEFLLHQDPSIESNIKTTKPILEKFTDEPALDYLPPPGNEDVDNGDIFDLKSNNDEWKKLLYGDCYKDINSKKDKNKDSKMKSIVVEDHIVESNDLLPQLLDNDSTLPEESSESSKNAFLSSSAFRNGDKVFNLGIFILGGTQILKDESKYKDLRDKDLILEDHNFLSISSDKELLFFLELTVIETLLSFYPKISTRYSIPGYLLVPNYNGSCLAFKYLVTLDKSKTTMIETLIEYTKDYAESSL
nr:hypothetical protein [Tanacetum cinerariifolium]